MAKGPILEVGDTVEVCGMPESSNLNGTVGTLTKTIGNGRWALKIEGEERTKVILEEHLMKRTGEDNFVPEQKFSIVGTWGDWEPQEMTWNWLTKCFEYKVTLGHDGAESFKVLQEGDWDKCIYPDRKDANPHHAHQVVGPDDGGVDDEWTIGLHAADEALYGDTFMVKFFVTRDGKPKRVTWEKIDSAPRPPAKEDLKDTMAQPTFQRPTAQAQDLDFNFNFTQGGQQHVPTQARSQQNRDWMSDDTRLAKEIVQVERQARERLAKRLEEASNLGMGMPMLQDGEDVEKPERMRLMMAREQEERDLQVEHNQNRYRQSVEESVRERAAATKAKSRVSSTCVECGQATNNMYGQSYCCETCLEIWEELRQEGWDGSSLCGGMPAAVRAQDLFRKANGRLTMMQARQKIMMDYGPSFRLN